MCWFENSRMASDTTCWCAMKLQCRRNCLSLFFYYSKRIGGCLFILYLLIHLLLYYQMTQLVNSVRDPHLIIVLESDIEPASNTTIKYGSSDLACQIPQLEPFSTSALAYLRTIDMKVENKCFHPELFKSTLDGRIVPVLSKEKMFISHHIRTCCYKNFSRISDYKNEMSEKCRPLSLTQPTRIAEEHEFIAILCENRTVDLHSFTHGIIAKPQDDGDGSRRKLNVVILGLDGVSRMNFMRTMPKSHSYLMDELEAAEMKGFHKVGYYTFQNVMPMLTSLSAEEMHWGCGANRVYDKCPFVWKLFGEKGYATSYAEDRIDISIFNYGTAGCCPGFKTQPTQHYLRTLTREAEIIYNNDKTCYGPRKTFQVLLDNVEKFVFEMRRKRKPFFQFTWSTGLSHDHNIRMAEYGDPHLLQFLKWMRDSGSFADTLFVLMSDHGWREGGFAESIQGQIESRLPLLYLVLPDWVKKGNYSRAYHNLLGNRERLVTSYDLHQLLLDILNPEGMRNETIEKRAKSLPSLGKTLPRGVSPFLPIPKWRTCEMSAIDPNYCSCRPLRKLRRNSTSALKAAIMTVEKINLILSSSLSCSTLSLSSIQMAQYGVQGDWQGVRVNFQTKPGNATFEALVTTTTPKFYPFTFLTKSQDWKVDGMISRTNLYGNQSWCVDDKFIKLYCYCA